MTKKVQHYLEYFLILFLEKITLNIRVQSRQKLAAYLASFFYHLVPIRKKIIQKNLRNAFPDRNPDWIKKYTRKTYYHFLRTYLDIFPVHKDPWQKFKKYVEIKDKDKIDKILSNGQGAVVVLFHFGNWEVPGSFYSRKNYNAGALYKKQSNPYVDRKILEARGWNGGTLFRKKESVLRMMRFIKNNGLLFMISDQDARGSGIFVNFFNRPSSSYRGPALFAIKFKTPLIAMTCIWKNGKYVISSKVFKTKSRKADKEGIKKLLQEYTSYFENKIRKYPEQYYWLHRRWKTSPQE
ncbi:MAG: lysophospholipid acyltransferase family protein [Candidatus Marinimicrobia bacterium]|nr:lysophospholipid acyltransferase family protein [Candidatus Neomarinimicrobiota bacterium]